MTRERGEMKARVINALQKGLSVPWWTVSFVLFPELLGQRLCCEAKVKREHKTLCDVLKPSQKKLTRKEGKKGFANETPVMEKTQRRKKNNAQKLRTE